MLMLINLMLPVGAAVGPKEARIAEQILSTIDLSGHRSRADHVNRPRDDKPMAFRNGAGAPIAGCLSALR